MRGSLIIASRALALLVVCSGCGGGDGQRVPVSGTVTLDGKPMRSVQVTFDRPDLSANENKSYAGMTDATGRYTLREAGKTQEGVPPAEYRVSLTTTVEDPANPMPRAKSTTIFAGDGPPPPLERIPRAYQGGNLKFPVTAEGTDKADFPLKSK